MMSQVNESSGEPNNASARKWDTGERAVYQIRLQGHLGRQWAASFVGMTFTLTEEGETHICGLIADQAALYGLLRKVRDLGLPLLAVIRVESKSA